jgi:hypothetical protein
MNQITKKSSIQIPMRKTQVPLITNSENEPIICASHESTNTNQNTNSTQGEFTTKENNVAHDPNVPKAKKDVLKLEIDSMLNCDVKFAKELNTRKKSLNNIVDSTLEPVGAVSALSTSNSALSVRKPEVDTFFPPIETKKSSPEAITHQNRQQVSLPNLEIGQTLVTKVSNRRTSLISLPSISARLKSSSRRDSHRGSSDRDSVYNVIKKLEEELESIPQAEEKDSIGKQEPDEIIINHSAHAKFFDVSDVSNVDIFAGIQSATECSSSDEDSDIEVDESTLNLIKRLRKSREAKVTAVDNEKSEQLDELEMEMTPKNEKIDQETSDSEIDSIFDLYDGELCKKESNQITSTTALPKTGLQSYPLAESVEELAVATSPLTVKPSTPLKVPISNSRPQSVHANRIDLKSRQEEAKLKQESLLREKR